MKNCAGLNAAKAIANEKTKSLLNLGNNPSPSSSDLVERECSALGKDGKVIDDALCRDDNCTRHGRGDLPSRQIPDAAWKALRDEYKKIWPGSWPAKPEAIRLAGVVIKAISASTADTIQRLEAEKAQEVAMRDGWWQRWKKSQATITTLQSERDRLRGVLTEISNSAFGDDATNELSMEGCISLARRALAGKD
jgi:hypothetical protein